MLTANKSIDIPGITIIQAKKNYCVLSFMFCDVYAFDIFSPGWQFQGLGARTAKEQSHSGFILGMWSRGSDWIV